MKYAAVAVVLALGLAGCSGSGGSDADRPTTTEKASTTSTTEAPTTTTSTTLPRPTTTVPPPPAEQYVQTATTEGLNRVAASAETNFQERFYTDAEMLNDGNGYCQRAREGLPAHPDFANRQRTGHEALKQDIDYTPRSKRMVELAMKFLCPDAQHILDEVLAGNIPKGPPLTEFVSARALVVNDDIAPGRYQTNDPDQGCYWERLDAAGEIIDNNFVASATQVQASIEPGDFSFASNDCGTWRKIG